MALRATVQQVRELIELNAEDSAIRNNYLVTANAYVDQYLLDLSLSSTMLTQIELYLAAHFAALVEEKGGLVQESMGASAGSVSDHYSAGLGATRFGQQAMILDSTGTLAGLGAARIKAVFRIV